jgi:hypothetical protein
MKRVARRLLIDVPVVLLFLVFVWITVNMGLYNQLHVQYQKIRPGMTQSQVKLLLHSFHETKVAPAEVKECGYTFPKQPGAVAYRYDLYGLPRRDFALTMYVAYDRKGRVLCAYDYFE